MPDTNRIRGRRAAAAFAGVLVAAALLTPSVSRITARASGPTITVSPGAGLQNGEFVTLGASGFAGGTNLSFAQCNHSPATFATDCTPINPNAGNDGTVSLSSNGSGGAFMPVYEGTDPNLENQAQNGSLTCDANTACTIAAFTTTPPSLSSAIVVTINFAPSPDLCPAVTNTRVVGSGAAAAGRAMYRWESTVCTPPLSLPVAYTPQNSPGGVSSFTGGAAQYAVTGPWSSADAPSSSSAPPQTWDYAPLANSSVVVAFLAFDQRTGAQVTKLTLTPDQLADVFTGALSAFGTDPGVTALNRGHRLPSISHALARSEHDSETWEFTSWLAQVAPTTWVYPGGVNAGHPIGATDTFPGSGTPTNLVTGGDAVGNNMIGQLRSGGSTQALFGVMDSSTAAFFGLPTVSVKRADGTVTSSTAATITQALQDGTGNPDGTITPDYATTDPNAWPMPMPLYALAPTNKIAAGAAATLAGFLHYVAGSGQGVLPNGYAPLTSAESAQTNAAAAAIPTNGTGSADAADTGSGGAVPDAGPPSGTDTSGLSDNGGDISGSDASGAGAGDRAGGGGHGAHTAIATSAQLALGEDGFGALAPALAGAGALCLLGGVGIEVASRIRRLRAMRRTRGR